MDYERALSSAWGIAASLTAIKQYNDLDAEELRNALWGVANLIEAAREDIDATFQASVEENARSLVEQRESAKAAARVTKPRSGGQSLYEQREAAMAQQDFLNAQTLAGQIAEISEASGEQYKDVLEEMGISAQELAERLHLDNVDQLDAWVETFQENNDENTNVVANLLREILAAIRGNDPSAGRVGGGPDGGGRDGRIGEGSSRTRTESDYLAERIGDEVGRRIEAGSSRNGRAALAAGPRGR